MRFRFSIRQLLIVIAFVAVGCAALARPDYWWHATVVSVTVLTAIGMLIAAFVGERPTRAFACGWLVFAVGYLAAVFGPWTGQQLGPQLITSKGIARLESTWHRDQTSPPVFGQPTMVWTDYDSNGNIDLISTPPGYVNYNGQALISGRLVTTGNSFFALSAARPQTTAQVISTNYSLFQSTGHWLVAVALGQLGGLFASALARRD